MQPKTSVLSPLPAPAQPANAERNYLEALINESEAAEFLRFAPRTLQNWRVRGGGPKFVRHRARTVRYRRKDLIAWLEERLVCNTSEASQAARRVQPSVRKPVNSASAISPDLAFT